MSWGRLDDGFHDHPKVEDLSLEAVGLWTLCLTRALRHRKTDAVPGFIPTARARKLAGRRTQTLVKELTTPPPGRKFGLWEPIEGGWLIHDFTDYLPKERDPQEASESGRKGAQAKWAKQGKQVADSQPDSHSNSQQTASQEPSSYLANDMAPDGPRASRSAYPSRPVPSVDSSVERERPETLQAVDATEPTCSKHPNGNPQGTPCAGCARVREKRDRIQEREQERAAAEAERIRRACDDCDGTGIVNEGEDRHPTGKRCTHPNVRRASRMTRNPSTSWPASHPSKETT